MAPISGAHRCALQDIVIYGLVEPGAWFKTGNWHGCPAVEPYRRIGIASGHLSKKRPGSKQGQAPLCEAPSGPFQQGPREKSSRILTFVTFT